MLLFAAGSAWMQLLLILFVAPPISPVGCDFAPVAEPTTCQPVLLDLAGLTMSSQGENVAKEQPGESFASAEQLDPLMSCRMQPPRCLCSIHDQTHSPRTITACFSAHCGPYLSLLAPSKDGAIYHRGGQLCTFFLSLSLSLPFPFCSSTTRFSIFMENRSHFD